MGFLLYGREQLEGITFSFGKGGLVGFLVGPLSSVGLKDGDTLLFSRPFSLSTRVSLFLGGFGVMVL